MGKKNKGRVPKVQINDIPKQMMVDAVKLYNKSPDTVRIYFDQLENSLIIMDERSGHFEMNMEHDNVLFIIGGKKNKKKKLNQADILKAINDELAFWFYTYDDITSDYE